ncbi:MAG: toll/interleukin-1 receptor domain-containing protein [Ilumatobacteraceae bacterium]
MTVAVQPLVVDVAWLDDGAVDVHPVAEAIFRLLSGDPDGRSSTRMGMPVHFRRITADGPAPDPATWPAADRRALVLLADSALLAALVVRNSPVRGAVEGLLAHAREAGWLLLPVALDPASLGNRLLSGETNMIRPPAEADAASTAAFVAGSVGLQLHRLLAPDRTVSTFISYATRDGSEIAEGLKLHLDSDTQLQSFLDRSQIFAGESFSKVLDEHVISGPVIAIVTDAYTASAWCGREILLAKQASQPVVVIDAVADGHDRSFPYLGNGPVARWQPADPQGTYRRVVRLAVEDSLRRTYLPLRIAHLCELAGVTHPEVVLTRAPELMTLVGAVDGAGAGDVVYPDPPIPSSELALLRAAFPALRLRTPTEVWR